MFSKIIERLEEEIKNIKPYCSGFMKEAAENQIVGIKFAIGIVNQVAEEYKSLTIEPKSLTEKFNDGWIPFEEEEPPHSDEDLLVQCNGRHKNIVFVDALELASYTEEGWYFPAYPEWDNAEVIAWRELPPAYEPKGE